MATLLITGSEGFIGKNLLQRLSSTSHKIIGIDLHHTEDDLTLALTQSDFIFHLAGVNRPTHEGEFKESNIDFTHKLLTSLEKLHKTIPLVVTSSTQAELDNPYGRSKKSMEELVLDWANRTHSKAFIYRLTNVFGKWCRPNYNSAVATFCHNITHQLPLTVSDPSKTLQLLYIDDLITCFLNTLENESHLSTGFYKALPTYDITLQSLIEKLYSFREIRKTLLLPDFKHPFDRALYATYLSYLPSSELNYSLNIFKDSRGQLSEILKSSHLGQIFISTTKSGITRGNHYHHTKVEKFIVLHGIATISLRNLLNNEVISYEVTSTPLQVIDIPPGYTHNITNTGSEDLITLFWSDELFNPLCPDTFFEKV